MSNSRFREVLVRHGSTVLVLGALSGVAWWGHHTGWKFSRPVEKAAAEDWCEAHGVPDSRCIACNPELGGANAADWCKEHGVPESKCSLCHPEILTGAAAKDWCKEHGVPESACPQCHPEIAVTGQTPPSEAGATVIDDPDAVKNSSTCQTHQVRVQFASPEAVRKAGVKVEAVQERPMAAGVTAPGEIRYDETRVARLAPRAAGTLVRVVKTIGQEVKRGDVLALVDAVEVGRARSALLEALAQVDVKAAAIERVRASVKQSEQIVGVRARALERVQSSAKEGFRSQADVQEAEGTVAEAEAEALKVKLELQEAEAALRESHLKVATAHQELTNLGIPVSLDELEKLPPHEVHEELMEAGIPDEVAHTLDEGQSTANLAPVVAPLDGVIVTTDAISGEVVDTSKQLFVVADVRRMWIVLDVRQEDVARVAVGQSVSFRPDAGRGDAISGKVSWISTAADAKTRTVKIRVDVENPDGRLRANTFGTGRIIVRQSEKAIAVPTAAVHWEGCCNVVFVRLTEDIFQTRKVQVGAREPPFTEVTAGVLPGELVATTGSHVLKSDLLKSKLGAG
ncbi:MAG: Multidrug resistance protein MdtA [Planctomycetes bacterium]|nr:Multidrug resistance protein MdtA [Planctomycetota bacterium]